MHKSSIKFGVSYIHELEGDGCRWREAKESGLAGYSASPLSAVSS
jgi:hypothetical protein